LCERLDTPVIFVASTVEANLVNTGLSGTLGDDSTHMSGRSFVASVLELCANFRIEGACGNQGRPRLIVDHLSVNVLRASKNGKPGAIGRSKDPLAHPPLSPKTPRLDKPLLVRNIHGMVLDSKKLS
jgi:hypothetical protein